MKNIDKALSVFFLCIAVVALILHDPTFSLACSAMAGVCRLDSEKRY